MSNLEIVNPKFTIVGHFNNDYMSLEPSNAEFVLADCPSVYVRDTMVKHILKNADIFARAYDFIAVDDDEGHRISVHWLVEKPAENEQKPLLVMNSHQELELIVYASKNGNMIKCRCHNTDAALSLADNWIILGYDVEIDDAEDYKVYFDSDFDLITVDENGNYKAVYLVGSR